MLDPVSAALIAGGTVGAAALSGGGGGSSPQMLAPDPMREAAFHAAQQNMRSAAKKYKGDLFADPTSLQQSAFNMPLQNIPLAQQTPVYQMGQGEIEKVLSGDYNPEDSLYYQSFRNSLQRELEKATDAIASRTSARDNFFGGGRLNQERELQEGGMNTIGQVLGQLQEAERQRMFAAAPMAMQIGQFNANEPFTRQGQLFNAGELERSLMQMELDKQYGEFVRRKNAKLGAGQALMGASTAFRPEYYVQQQSPSPWGSLIGGAMTGIGLAGGVGNFFGGGSNWGVGAESPFEQGALSSPFDYSSNF